MELRASAAAGLEFELFPRREVVCAAQPSRPLLFSLSSSRCVRDYDRLALPLGFTTSGAVTVSHGLMSARWPPEMKLMINRSYRRQGSTSQRGLSDNSLFSLARIAPGFSFRRIKVRMITWPSSAPPPAAYGASFLSASAVFY